MVPAGEMNTQEEEIGGHQEQANGESVREQVSGEHWERRSNFEKSCGRGDG